MNIKIITLQRELNCNDKTENKWMYVKKLTTKTSIYKVLNLCCCGKTKKFNLFNIIIS